MLVAIAKSAVTYIPVLIVPNQEIGQKVINELKALDNSSIYSLVGGADETGVRNYKEFSWKTV